MFQCSRGMVYPEHRVRREAEGMAWDPAAQDLGLRVQGVSHEAWGEAGVGRRGVHAGGRVHVGGLHGALRAQCPVYVSCLWAVTGTGHLDLAIGRGRARGWAAVSGEVARVRERGNRACLPE